jgi:NAD+ synthase (glutamine-hydrolysing)
MRLALAQINPTIGDLAANAALIASFIAQARSAGADLVVFPELALCGYPPKDLLLQDGFIAACTAAAKELGGTQTQGLTAVFGVPLPVDRASPRGRIANSLVAYRDNRFVDYYDKRLLPTYDVFDEDRYFTPGTRAVVLEVPQRSGSPVRVGLAICEDLWRGEDAGFASHYTSSPDPVAELAAAGAEVLVVPSASPFVLGKGRRHRAILHQHAKRHGLHVASVNQVGGNDELVFDGHAAVYAPDGSLIAAAPGFEEHLLVVDIVGRHASPDSVANRASIPATPAIPDPLLTAPVEQLLFSALVLGTRDYCRKTGFTTALLGLSGGIDSAVVAVIAAAALGPANITGLSLPGRYSSPGSKTDAYDLARRLGITILTVPIDAPLTAFSSTLNTAFRAQKQPILGATMPDITEENLQSRIRGTILMALSNRTGAIVLTTGNKSELAVGYCTLYGDMNGGLAVLSDVPKMQVYSLARWINANHASLGLGVAFDQPPIPEASITKPPSAELRPDQTDQDSLPPYETLDRIIEHYVERRDSPARIIDQTGIDAATVRRIARMIDTAEYKRKQLATGLKVTSVAFGFGRRFPIAQGWTHGRA